MIRKLAFALLLGATPVSVAMATEVPFGPPTPAGLSANSPLSTSVSSLTPSADATLASAPSGGIGMPTLVMTALFLGGCAWLAVIGKRKFGSQQAQKEDGIEILASRAIGKSKLVLVRAQDAEMLLSIGEGGAKLISRLPSRARGAKQPQLGNAISELRSEPAFAPDPTPPLPMPNIRRTPSVIAAASAAPHQSPSIAGLLKLRRQNEQKMSSDTDEAMSASTNSIDPEADAEWAQELLRATRSSRGKKAYESSPYAPTGTDELG